MIKGEQPRLIALPIEEQIKAYIQEAQQLGINLVEIPAEHPNKVLETINYPRFFGQMDENGSPEWMVAYYHIIAAWPDLTKRGSQFSTEVGEVTNNGLLQIRSMKGLDQIPKFSIFGGPLDNEPRLIPLAIAALPKFPKTNPFRKTYMVLPGAKSDPGMLAQFARSAAGMGNIVFFRHEGEVFEDITMSIANPKR